MQLSDAIQWRHNKSKMADGRHIENRFFWPIFFLVAILADQREIWNRDEVSHANMSHNQNCNCRKFNMADGRHFENSIISISKPRIIRFRSNLVGRCTSNSHHGYLSKIPNFASSRWRTDAILKIFLAISRRHIDRLMRNLDRKTESHTGQGQVTKIAIFENSRWLTVAILKIASSP